MFNLKLGKLAVYTSTKAPIFHAGLSASPKGGSIQKGFSYIVCFTKTVFL